MSNLLHKSTLSANSSPADISAIKSLLYSTAVKVCRPESATTQSLPPSDDRSRTRSEKSELASAAAASPVVPPADVDKLLNETIRQFVDQRQELSSENTAANNCDTSELIVNDTTLQGILGALSLSDSGKSDVGADTAAGSLPQGVLRDQVSAVDEFDLKDVPVITDSSYFTSGKLFPMVSLARVDIFLLPPVQAPL